MVKFEWTSSNPLTILPVASVLSDFADVDFRVEVGSKSFVVVTSVAVDDVEIVHFVEMVFSSLQAKRQTSSMNLLLGLKSMHSSKQA